MQETAPVPTVQPTTVTTTLGDILSSCSHLEALAEDILWRVRGNRGSPPTGADEATPQPVEHRFVQESSEALDRLRDVEKSLQEAVSEFDRTFGV